MRKTAALANLLLRTVYFHPFSNPVFVGIALLFLFFNLTRDLNVHHALLAMYGVGLSHRFIGMLGHTHRGRNVSTRHGWLPTSFLTLPVTRRQLAAAFVCASLCYLAVIQGGLAFTLYRLDRTVELKEERIVEETTPAGDVIRKRAGLQRIDSYPYRGQYVFKAYVIHPSYFLDLFTGVTGRYFAVFLFFMVFSILDALVYFGRMFNTGASGTGRLVIPALRTAYYVLGIALVFDVLLPHRLVRAATAALEHAAVPLLALVALVAGYVAFATYRFLSVPAEVRG